MRKLMFPLGLALTTMAANAQETAHLSGTVKGLDVRLTQSSPRGCSPMTTTTLPTSTLPDVISAGIR